MMEPRTKLMSNTWKINCWLYLLIRYKKIIVNTDYVSFRSLQIAQALQMQIEVQSELHEQIEVKIFVIMTFSF